MKLNRNRLGVVAPLLGMLLVVSCAPAPTTREPGPTNWSVAPDGRHRGQDWPQRPPEKLP